MALFGAIKNILQGNQFESTLSKVTRIVETAIVHPIGFLTDTEKAYKTTEKESLAQKVVGGASNALLVVAPFTGAVKTAVTKTVASTILKAPVKSAVVGLVGGGALISSPTIRTEVVKTISGAPENLIGAGETVGGIVEGVVNPADVSEPEWYSIARGLGLGAGIAVLLAGGVYLGYKLYNNKLKKVEETAKEKVEETAKIIDTGNVAIPENKQTPTNLGIPSVAPTMETQSISSTKKRYKRTKTKETPQVRQTVNLMINNSTKSVGITNKRYIKGLSYV